MAMLKGKAEVRIFYESLIALLMEKPIVNDTLEREGNQVTSQQDIFSYYRRLRSNLFSDTEVVYETKLTPELFDLKLQQLSQDKKQSEFENFVLGLATRLVTPNIKPQTGPDGGGDGKVDGETYPVDKAISDKWWVSEGNTGDHKWAIAISVQKNWKSKIEGDVKKAVETGRGYTKVIFFSSQKIKSSKRQEVEDELSKQYGVAVSIFDGKWCSFAVFEQGCYDVATEKLNFSEEYRRKTVKEGSNDKRRKEELETLENDLLSRQVENLDTDYVDDLLRSCLLSRGLERPRMETEGRFNRAQREAEAHGSSVQRFNITYHHAWTSFFWFHDVNAMYADYLKLKEYANMHTTVHTIELTTNILTNLENAAGVGLFDSERFRKEVQDLKTIKERKDLSQASRLFLELFFSEHRLLQMIHCAQDPTSELKKLAELIKASANYPDICFDAQITIVEIIGCMIDDNEEYEKLIDDISEISSQRKSEVEGAIIHFNRAQTLIDKQQYKPVVKHLGHCVHAFLKEGYETELVKTYGYMGIALYNLELPYSAKAYLVKAASILVKEFFTKGTISHLLITVLWKLCEIELMTGRLVMYLNWRELLFVIAHNGQEIESKEFVEKDVLFDGGWACHFATADLTRKTISFLPDIFARCDMPISENYLKYALGYQESVDKKFVNLITDDWGKLLKQQPIHKQFLNSLNIAEEGQNTISTLVKGCRFTVRYENSIRSQLVSETFLATVETLLATFDTLELVVMSQEIQVEIVPTDGQSELERGENGTKYIFRVNYDTLDGETYWRCFAFFMAHFMSLNTVSNEEVKDLIAQRHEKEKIMDRIIALLELNNAVYNVLGDKFKYSICQWKNANDKTYVCKADIKGETLTDQNPHTEQQGVQTFSISSTMEWWEKAGWTGVYFIYDTWLATPPIIGLAFKNLEAGKRIIHEWKEKITKGEPSVELYLIKGIDKQHPSWYRACVAPEIPFNHIIERQYIAVMCQKRTMTPNDTSNLDYFERVYSRFGNCQLVAVAIDDQMHINMDIDFSEAIEPKKVIITDAWKVSAGPIGNALEWDDDPIIPKSESTTAPVIELMKNLREVHNKMENKNFKTV